MEEGVFLTMTQTMSHEYEMIAKEKEKYEDAVYEFR